MKRFAESEGKSLVWRGCSFYLGPVMESKLWCHSRVTRRQSQGRSGEQAQGWSPKLAVGAALFGSPEYRIIQSLLLQPHFTIKQVNVLGWLLKGTASREMCANPPFFLGACIRVWWPGPMSTSWNARPSQAPPRPGKHMHTHLDERDSHVINPPSVALQLGS